MDEGTLQQAFTALQSRFGKRLAGDMLKGEVAMRHALMDQLQVDESAADKLVKQLSQTGWILFRGGAAAGADDNFEESDGGADRGGPLPDGWRDSRVADADAPGASALMAAPLVGASSTMGIQQSGNQGPSGAGGAVLAGAAAAELTSGRDQPSERPDPERDENQISSEAADHAQAARSEDGYWQISGPPIVGTT